MKRTTRRVLLAASGALTLSACAGDRRRRTQPTPRTTNTPSSPPLSLSPHRETLIAAIAAAGGLDFISRGETVLLKVNTNSGDPYPYSTSPEVVRWLGQHLHKRGADVIVGDRSFWGDGDTRGNFGGNGIAAAARGVGAKLVAFEPDEVAWVELDANKLPHWRPPIRIPRVFAEVQHVINLPCVKTHFITGVTLSIKNLLGVVHPQDRARDGNLRSHHPDRIYHQIAEVHGAVRKTFNVLDGYRSLTSGGPTPGSGAAPEIKRLGRVFASHSRVEVDSAGIALLRQHAATGEAVHDDEVNENLLLRAVGALAQRGVTGS